MISLLLKKIFSYLFPLTCIICGDEQVQASICPTCSESLLVNREIRRPWLFSLYRYQDEPVSTCVKHLKNFPDQDLAFQLLLKKQLMITGWVLGLSRFHRCDQIVIIPVPLHHSRFLDRGYNQAEIIALAFKKVLTSTIKIPLSIETGIINKSKQTEKQATITDRAKRFKNIHNAFTLNSVDIKKLSPNTLAIIIDDVTTTGGTMDEIKNLLDPYVKTVAGFTLAR